MILEAAEHAASCRRCDLAETRHRVVYGAGSSAARMVIVGEAPGAREDECGRPFVGRSGKLLTDLLDEVGLARADVYITNIVKCRPPDNRNPRSAEIVACSPHLNFQLATIAPHVVVTLGNFATRHILQSAEGITRLRGTTYPWADRTVVPTFHPAAALRQGGTVRDAMRSDLALAAALIQESV